MKIPKNKYMPNRLNIAIFAIDDDSSIRVLLKTILDNNNINNYSIYSDPKELLVALHKGVQICVIDYELKHQLYNGISLMKEVKRNNNYCKCIIMSGYEDASRIKDFLNEGAFRYLTKGENNFSTNLVTYIKQATEEIIDTFGFYSDLLGSITKTRELFKTFKDETISDG